MPRRFWWIDSREWDLDGLAPEACDLLQFLYSNARARPSGISRVTDAQLAADRRTPVKRVRDLVRELATRGHVVRDGAWLLVVRQFLRTPKTRTWLTSVREDLKECPSPVILTAWGTQYPHFHRWVDERLTALTPPRARTAAPGERPGPHAPARAPAAAATNRARETFRGGEPERAGDLLTSELDRMRREAGSA